MSLVNDKCKNRNKIISLNVSPLTLMQIQSLQEKLGENASKLMVRAIDSLYNRYIADKTFLRMSKRPFSNQKEK